VVGLYPATQGTSLARMTASGRRRLPIQSVDATFWTLRSEKEVLVMKRRPQIYHSDSQKALTQDRWQKGGLLIYGQFRLNCLPFTG